MIRALLAALSLVVVPAIVEAAGPSACSALSAQDAAALVGAPLPEFYGHGAEMDKSRGGKVAALSGAGEAGRVKEQQFTGVNVATATFHKGVNVAQIQVWRKGSPAVDTAKAASTHVAERLPGASSKK